MLLEPRGDVAQLLVCVRHHALELANWLRCADAGHHVLALGVDEELAEEFLLAGRRIAGETDAGAGPIAGVPEHHHLHVHGCADVIGNVVDAPVFLRPRIHPRTEDGVAGHLQLFGRVLRKIAASPLQHDALESLDDIAQRRLVEIGIELRARRSLHRVEFVLERILRNLEDDVAEHLDEAAVAVEREPAILGALLQPFDGDVVQPEVQDGIHHAGHRELRAGPHRHEQRVFRGSELRAGRRLEPLQVLVDLAIDCGRDSGVLLVVDVADGGGNREAGRHREAGIGHLGKPCALAAEHVLHIPVAVGLSVGKEIDVLLHLRRPHGLRRRPGGLLGLRRFRQFRQFRQFRHLGPCLRLRRPHRTFPCFLGHHRIRRSHSVLPC